MPDRRDGVLDVILLTDTDSACGYHQIRLLGSQGQHGPGAIEIIRHRGNEIDLSAEGFQERLEHGPVAVIDLSRQQWLTGLDDLVTTREQGHPRTLPHFHFGDALARQVAQCRGIKPVTTRQQHAIGLHIATTRTDIIVYGYRSGNKGSIAGTLDLLLHDHTVRPGGQRCSGKNPCTGAT